MTEETKRGVVAIALGETSGCDDPRRVALSRQLALYRDGLDGIAAPRLQAPQMNV
jgi:hypothetical protein